MFRKLFIPALSTICMGMALSTSAKAAPVSCDDVARLRDFLGGGVAADGCIQQDKLYSNFSYVVNGVTQTFTSTGTFAPSRVGVLVTFGVNGLGQDIHTIEFGPLSNWTVPFSIAYTVSIYPTSSVGRIVGADNQGTYPLPTGKGVLTTTVNPGNWIVTATPAATDPGPQYFAPIESVTLRHSYAPGSPASNLEGFKETVTEQFPVPEPASYVVMGSSLFALGFVGRRISRRQRSLG